MCVQVVGLQHVCVALSVSGSAGDAAGGRGGVAFARCSAAHPPTGAHTHLRSHRSRVQPGVSWSVCCVQFIHSNPEYINQLTLCFNQNNIPRGLVFAVCVCVCCLVALCSGVCVLSLSWALVLYSRACCLARPGHLLMPPAALLCQLLWRVGLLSARFTSLALFTRSFGCWVIGVVGE